MPGIIERFIDKCLDGFSKDLYNDCLKFSDSQQLEDDICITGIDIV